MGGAQFLIERVLRRASARARAESPRAGELLSELTGKTLALEISGTPWALRPILIQSNGHALNLTVAAATRERGAVATPLPDADARIIGAPLSLLALTRGEPEALVRRGDVRIEGDPQLAQRFHELGQLFAPDLEQALSHLFGRSAAHVLVGAARAAAGSVRRTAWTSVQNLAEYLAFENGDLVSRQEAEHFLRGVEQARDQLDRIDARLGPLELRCAVLAGGSESS